MAFPPDVIAFDVVGSLFSLASLEPLLVDAGATPPAAARWFARVDRAARMARNPATGEPVKVKASRKAKITALKAYKDGVMSQTAAPKLAKGVWPPAPAAKPSAKKAAAKKAPAKASRAPKKSAPAKSAKKAPTKRAAKRS